MNYFFYISISIFLILARQFFNFYAISILFPLFLFFLLIYSIFKKNLDYIWAIALLPFFEFYEVFNNSPAISIPYILISFFLIFLKFYHSKNININLIYQILLIIIFSLISLILYDKTNELIFFNAKLTMTAILILLAANSNLNQLVAYPEDIFLKKMSSFLKKILSFTIIFFIVEFVMADLYPPSRNNIQVGFDWRPIGFMSEPTYISFYITAIALNYYYLSGVTIEFLISLVLVAINLSRVFLPSLAFSLLCTKTIVLNQNKIFISKKILRNIFYLILFFGVIFIAFLSILNTTQNEYILDNLDIFRFV